MSTRRPKFSRRRASRMLDDPTAYAGDAGLGAALSAASTPGLEPASRGEERAAAEFRSVAHPDPVPTLGGTPAMTRFTRKIAAVPAAILAAAGLVVAGGGIALAASQGAVHVPFTGHDNRPADAPSATATVNPGLTHTDEPTDEATDDAADESEGTTPGATPSPSLKGLCVAFQAGAMDHAATNPAFTALQTAAGGADNVAAYCVGLIGERSHPTHPAKPTQAATPHEHPAHPAKPTHAPDKPEKPSRVASH